MFKPEFTLELAPGTPHASPLSIQDSLGVILLGGVGPVELGGFEQEW